jgi:hypothetical protein
MQTALFPVALGMAGCGGSGPRAGASTSSAPGSVSVIYPRHAGVATRRARVRFSGEVSPWGARIAIAGVRHGVISRGGGFWSTVIFLRPGANNPRVEIVGTGAYDETEITRIP